MSSISENNKRIAKNSLMLYVRMIILMVISLYTSRATLSVLGISDYGIYQVVGGIIVVFSFLSVALSSSTQRFLNYEMGRGNMLGLKTVFSNSIMLHILISIFIIILGETIGLWFLNTYLQIPFDRYGAAQIVYHCTIISFVINVLSVPFNATIIAHEKMSAFAYISIAEALLKLFIVLMLKVANCDKLILYAILTVLVCAIIQLSYMLYCYNKFSECRFVANLVNKNGMKEIASFSGWTLLGGIRSVCHTQGISILINMFYGVAVNAAQGITNQVTTIVNNVVYNFLTALNPQIVQYYASNKTKELHNLVLRGCRISIYLVSLLVIPLFLEINNVLEIWLKEVPLYTDIFIRFSLLAVLFQPYATVLQTAKGASGDVKKYQIVLFVIGFLHLPFTYIAFKQELPPYSAMAIYFIIVVAIQIARILFACNAIEMNTRTFFMEIIRCYMFVFLSSLPAIVIHYSFDKSLITTLLVGAVNTCCSVCILLFWGFPKSEREKILYIIKTKIHRV